MRLLYTGTYTLMQTKKRFDELEGLRGLAAIAVVVSHFILAFYPALITGNMKYAHTSYEGWVHGTPLAIGYAGTFAVAIFFVLSGFVLSVGFFRKGDAESVKSMAMGRYLRLMIPALTSVLLAYILIKIGSGYIASSAGDSTKSWYLHSWVMDAGLVDAVKNGMVGIFMDGGSAYNNVLWTMKIEFFGSFLVFVFLLLFAKSKYRLFVYLGLAAATFNTWFLPFVIGIAIADLYMHGRLDNLKHSYFVLPLLAGGILFGSFPHKGVELTLYSILQKLDFSWIGVKNFHHEMFYLTIGATMFILAVLLSRRLAQFLKHPRVSTLGKYTFALYLTHPLILLSFSSGMFVVLHNTLGYNKAAVLTMILSIPVIMVVTKIFERYVDTPSIKFAKIITSVLRGKQKLDIKQRMRQYAVKPRILAEKYIGFSGRPERVEPAD